MKKISLSHSQSIYEGDYVTDRRRLYRVLEILPVNRRKRAAILEDCSTLDASLFRPRDLKRMRLQPVRWAPLPSV